MFRKLYCFLFGHDWVVKDISQPIICYRCGFIVCPGHSNLIEEAISEECEKIFKQWDVSFQETKNEAVILTFEYILKFIKSLPDHNIPEINDIIHMCENTKPEQVLGES